MAKPLKFLGKGLNFPLRFSSSGGTSTNFGSSVTEGIDKVKTSLYVLLYTKIGERFMRRDFGTNIGTLVFSPIDLVIQEILTDIKEAIARYEKRVIVNQLNIIDLNPKSGKVIIGLSFSIIGSNVTGNLVFPYNFSNADSNQVGVIDTTTGA